MMLVLYPIADDTIPIPFDAFGGTNGESITITGLAVTDIEVYKDTSTTQRASDNGYALIDTDGIDIDGTTGIHGFSIDLSDNSDSGFYEVGPWYRVVVAGITVDGQTVNFTAAVFRIVSATRGLAGTALPDAAADAAGGLAISDAGGLDLDGMNTTIDNIFSGVVKQRTTIATLTSQTSFTLTAGSADDDAYNNHAITITDSVTGVQKASGYIDTYVGATKTVNLDADPGTFTMGVGDIVEILHPTASLRSYLGDNAITQFKIMDNSITAGKINADAIGASQLAADAVTEIQSGLATSAALATVDSIVDSILVDTGEIGTAGAGLTNIPWNAAWDSEVQSEVDDALAAVGLKTISEPSAAPSWGDSPGDMIGFLMTRMLNKLTQTSAVETIRNSADTGNISTRSVSDDGTTLTKGAAA